MVTGLLLTALKTADLSRAYPCRFARRGPWPVRSSSAETMCDKWTQVK